MNKNHGTSAETQGMLLYTEKFDHVVFEVTESSSDLVNVGATWVFPEIEEGF